eukprot:3150461-Amphidinium_carterae.3
MSAATLHMDVAASVAACNMVAFGLNSALCLVWEVALPFSFPAFNLCASIEAVSVTTGIVACEQGQHWLQALSLLHDMHEKQVQADVVAALALAVQLACTVL